MQGPTLYEQREQLFRPGRVDFVYRYGHDTCCAEVFFSDGARWWYFAPSNIPGDALQALLDALARMLHYDEPEAHARWFDEPGEWHWVLRREGNLLHITVLRHSDFRGSDRPVGSPELQTSVDLWAFLQRVRLAASRVAETPVGEAGRRVSLENDPAYHTICRVLADHRHSATRHTETR